MQAYLESAAARGVLGTLGDQQFVFGRSDSGFRAQPDLFLEYVAPELLQPFSEFERVLRFCLNRAGEVGRVIIRSERPIDNGFSPLLTYVIATSRVQRTFSSTVRIVEKAGIPPVVRNWLVLAAKAADRAADPRRIESALDALISGNQFNSFIAFDEDRPIAHSCVMHDQNDGPTGLHFSELLDTWVESDIEDRAHVLQAVTARAIQSADENRLPLLGHVVYLRDNPQQAVRVLQGLLARGWLVHHSYYVMEVRDAR